LAKIVIIGAGSGFGGRLSVDILAREPLRDATIALCDIDETRLSQVQDYVTRAMASTFDVSRLHSGQRRRKSR
jgi:alpha-galactosidase